MSVHFNRYGKLIVVHAELCGPHGSYDARLALDTGATTTLVNEEPLVLLGYDVTATTETSEVAMGSGMERVPLIPVERIRTLNQERMDLRVLCHTLPPEVGVDGLLGLDFFRDQSLTIDFRRGEISLG